MGQRMHASTIKLERLISVNFVRWKLYQTISSNNCNHAGSTDPNNEVIL